MRRDWQRGPCFVPCYLAIGCWLLAAGVAEAQTPGSVSAERTAYTEWLATAANSPFAALGQFPVGQGLVLGPAGSDLPLAGAGTWRVRAASGNVIITGNAHADTLRPGKLARLGRYRLSAGGQDDRAVVTVFDSSRTRSAPVWFPYDRSVVFTGPLNQPASASHHRVLAPYGVEVTAEDAGTVIVPIAGQTVRLSVMRMPDAATGQPVLEIYFRDGTNGEETYPAGRFVSLEPTGTGHWRLDFNRARNPWCAYSAAYPCPAPWRGNVIPAPIHAGERYHATEPTPTAESDGTP
jgi:uncharacterized protein (DUF1684 family)